MDKPQRLFVEVFGELLHRRDGVALRDECLLKREVALAGARARPDALPVIVEPLNIVIVEAEDLAGETDLEDQGVRRLQDGGRHHIAGDVRTTLVGRHGGATGAAPPLRGSGAAAGVGSEPAAASVAERPQSAATNGEKKRKRKKKTDGDGELNRVARSVVANSRAVLCRCRLLTMLVPVANTSVCRRRPAVLVLRHALAHERRR